MHTHKRVRTLGVHVCDAGHLFALSQRSSAGKRILSVHQTCYIYNERADDWTQGPPSCTPPGTRGGNPKPQQGALLHRSDRLALRLP
eukprot:268709-Alexandrium_andersonii.AAC.1